MINVKALATLQFTKVGERERVHLVRMTDSGTPGDTLCGLERFGPDAVPSSWSVGGGITGPGLNLAACAACADLAFRFYAAAPVWGSTHGALFPRHAKSPWSVRNLPVVASEL
ncbi:hypothetical protein SEA_RENNA12_58 [Arthrobacter phage Renna12]|nr:hypothetical protein SEA_RENNA12_58 [Arthrobacter phage Renna12]